MNTDMIKELRNLDKNDILNALGLETRRSNTDMVLPVLGIFTAGLLTGLGAGLMLAPKSGQSLRDDARDYAKDAQGQIKGKMDQARDYAKSTANKVSEHVAD
jgi:hypothetical protein